MKVDLFWVSLVSIGYVYFGYPLLLITGLLGRRRPVLKGSLTPTLSVIIPAHNEESVIEKKIQNVLALDYPRDRVEIRSGERRFGRPDGGYCSPLRGEGVRLLAHPEQRGKSAIQNELVAQSSGEILVFTDADCLLSRDAVSRVVENFADPRVGFGHGAGSVSQYSRHGCGQE